METLRNPRTLLALVVIALLAPFANKAFHIDDPLFLWMAQQIAKHPLDPYGFSVNWASFSEPMWIAMQNPPLCSYYIAAVASLAGWSEPALHVAFLLWAVLAVLGTYSVARRFCAEPGLAAMLALFTPVFLVSATNVMCDVMLLALWMWAIEFWLAGVERERLWFFAVSALLIAAAALTKYFGIALVPLLAAYTLARQPRSWFTLLFFAVPTIAIVAYEYWTRAKYGQGLFSFATFYSRNAATHVRPSLAGQAVTGLSFLGGTLVAPLFYVSARNGKAVAFVAILAIAAGCAFVFLLPLNAAWQLATNMLAVRAEGAVFAAIGACALALCCVDLIERRDADSLLLTLWVIGTFAFATFLNWSITARTFLPIAPPIAILLVRRAPKYWPLRAMAIVSLLVALADYHQAESGRQAAAYFAPRAGQEQRTVWIQSHWGFQYYMEQAGARPLDSRNSDINSGDVMIVPANNTAVVEVPREAIVGTKEKTFPVLPYLTTFGRGTGAAFYSSIRGPLPWAVDQVPPELYYVATFR